MLRLARVRYHFPSADVGNYLKEPRNNSRRAFGCHVEIHILGLFGNHAWHMEFLLR